jgi:hypothetical protein
MRSGGLDWQKHQLLDWASFFDYQVDIHHIFPHAWCEKNKIDDARRESIVNKTAISASTNRSIGGRAPSVYMQTLQSAAKVSGDQLDAVVSTHLIDPKLLRSDDFSGFFVDRSEKLLRLISEAMGKEAIRENSADEGNPEAFEPEDELEPEVLGEPPTAPIEPANRPGGNTDLPAITQVDLEPGERAFGSAMKNIYQEAERKLNYRPTYFLRMLSELGPLETARQLTMASTPSDGFTRLWEAGRLDLTVEAHVIRPEFRGLFESYVVDAAWERLRAYGYRFPEDS